MLLTEVSIWERLSKSRKSPLEACWLAKAYKVSIDANQRWIIAERLGWMGEKGWPLLKDIIQKEGAQPELINAAGLCHQPEAKKWLLKLLKDSNQRRVEVLQALACWGADLPISFLHNVLQEKSQPIRLAGLEMLNFKAYQLSDKLLLELLKESLADFRAPVLLRTLRILQRRNSVSINAEIVELARTGSEVIAKAALLALGSIGTSNSQKSLLTLSQELPCDSLKELAQKQYHHQYKVFNQEE